jgi:hypothetical protein
LLQDVASKQTVAFENFGTKAQDFVQAHRAAAEYNKVTNFLKRWGVMSTKEDENTALARYKSARAALLEAKDDEEETNIVIVGWPNWIILFNAI